MIRGIYKGIMVEIRGDKMMAIKQSGEVLIGDRKAVAYSIDKHTLMEGEVKEYE